ncbi:MAG: hypothetical protein DRG33_05320 [Deltaproteobacteria bacterium]|nr:MAG: hypothetical protein DRG33_05320 [Deltaproteobacteria bacterium]
MRSRGQATPGELVALLVLIAVGSVVLYSITPAMTESFGNDTTTIDNLGTGTVEARGTIQSATLSVSYDLNADARIGITVNGNLIDNSLYSSGTGSFENTITDYVTEGTNTVVVTAENSENVNNITTTVTINTYGGSAVSNVEEKGSTVFNLMTILVIVLVAALIIGVVVSAIGGVRRPERPGPEAL